jgi:protein KTI12
LEELLMRFEEPNPMTRWDSPLFVIDCNPAALTTDEGEQEDEGKETWENAPLDAIWDAITKGKVSKAPDVVAPIRGTSTNYLSLLESTTQLVLSSFQEIISFGNLPEMGGLVQLSINFSSSDASKVSLPFYLPVGKKAPTTASLQRLRRQFIKMHASGASAGNELGHLLGKEGSSLPSHPSFNGRAERKFQRNNGPAMKESNQPKSIEEQLARRFIAYLEETL